MTPKKQQLIRKSNAITRAAYVMTLTEQRLILMAISEATKLGYTDNPPGFAPIITLHYADFAKTFNTTWANAERDLIKAGDNLLGMKIYLEDEDETGFAKQGHVWLNFCEYGTKAGLTGKIQVRFNPEIFEHLCQLVLKGEYTQTFFELMAKFKSSYSIRLYEYCKSWMNMRNHKAPKPVSIENLKLILGVEPEKYPVTNDFKRYVLNRAIDEVGKLSDIKVTCKDVVTERRITHFILQSSFKETKSKITNERTFNDKRMTEAQKGLFCGRLVALPEFSKYAKPGQSDTSLKSWIHDELDKPERLQEWWPLLEQVGFKYHALLTEKVNLENEGALIDAEVEAEEIYWNLKTIKQAAFSLSQDKHFMEVEAEGLKPDEALEWMQDVLGDKEGREKHWSHLKRHVPEGVTP